MILLPFSSHSSRITIDATSSKNGDQIEFDFNVSQGAEYCDFNNPNLNSKLTKQRADGLWQFTCFEAFLGVAESNNYYEFNFSPELAWNVYRFDDYRSPKTATPTSEFELLQIDWQNYGLKAIVKNLSPYTKFDLGLCSVILSDNKEKTYFALKHCGKNADFHLRESFVLKL